MSWKRKILAVVFPPFAVVDKGCGIHLIAFILTCLGWIPGIIYAFAYLKWEQRHQGRSNSPVSKMQSKSSTKGNSTSGTPQQSPFNRPRRMSNNTQNSNNQPGGWQGW